MKFASTILTTIFWAGCLYAEPVALPDKHITGQLDWATSGKTAGERAVRLQAVWDVGFQEDDRYEDASHYYAVVSCAWYLTRAYIEIGEKEKAIKYLTWLCENDSKSGVTSLINKAEQDGAGQPATRSESDSEGGEKPQPEAEGRSQ